jgi:hypothetical protein
LISNSSLRSFDEIASCNDPSLFYLDFEKNKKDSFYLAGVFNAGVLSQTVLTPDLEGLAKEKSLEIVLPLEFVQEFLRRVEGVRGIVVAYSLHEKNVIEELTDSSSGFVYCNLRKAAVKWAKKFKKEEYKNMPPLKKKASNFEKRGLHNSLASIMRLLDNPAPSSYAHGKTTSRFNAVISGLEKREGEYSRLTGVQKSKATKVLNHNRYDVECLPRLWSAISGDDIRILKNSCE